jgi:hypothetical protein
LNQAALVRSGDSVANATVQAAVEAKGGIFAPATDTNVAAAALIVQKLRAKGANESACDAVMLAAFASSAYAGVAGGTQYSKAIAGGGTAATITRAIPSGVTAVLRIKGVGIVTTKGGGSEAVGDTYHLDTELTVKNVAGTVSIVSSLTQVSVTDADTSQAATTYGFTASGGNLVITITNAAGLNAATVDTHVVNVSEQDYAA